LIVKNNIEIITVIINFKWEWKINFLYLCVAEFISGGGRGGYDNQRSDSRGGGGGRGGYSSNFSSGSNYSGESGKLNPLI
jgi:hypothetical protein